MLNTRFDNSSIEALAGVNKNEDAKLIQKVINMLSEFGEHFQQETIITFSKSVDKDLQKFVDSDDTAIIKKSGRSIHREVSNLYGLLAEKLKEQQINSVK